MPPMSLIGEVTKVGYMNKTATVAISRLVFHPKTGKRLKQSNKYPTHDESNRPPLFTLPPSAPSQSQIPRPPVSPELLTMEPLQFSRPAHSSPIRPERLKHHDTSRFDATDYTSRFDATDYDQRVLIDEVRPGMVQELFGKAVWLSASAFQNTVLPKPPQRVMPSDTHITAMTTQFREMVKNFKSRAKEAHRKAGRRMMHATLSLFGVSSPN